MSTGNEDLIAALGVTIIVLLWAVFVWHLTTGQDAAIRRELRRQGCECPWGIKGVHHPECPLHQDETDEAGA